MKARAYFLCGALLAVATASSASDLITVNMTARVIDVYDDTGVLGNQIAVGQAVSGSYSYDTSVADQDSSWNYGHYPQWQGGIRLSAGSLVFETDPASYPGGYYAVIHPSDYPGYYQGFFRLMSQGNKPLANGASVSWIDIDFSDYSGYAPTSDALPAGAPDLQSFPVRRIHFGGDLNGSWYHVVLEIEEVQLEYAGSDLVVSPGESTFLRDQQFDAALLLPPGSEVVWMLAKVGGMPLPLSFPGSCHIAPPNSHGLTAIVCPNAQWSLPPSGGTNHIEWEVGLTDGTILRNAVDWKLIP